MIADRVRVHAVAADQTVALRVASRLMREGLADSVIVHQTHVAMRIVDGALTVADEVLFIARTTADRADAYVARAIELDPLGPDVQPLVVPDPGGH